MEKVITISFLILHLYIDFVLSLPSYQTQATILYITDTNIDILKAYQKKSK